MIAEKRLYTVDDVWQLCQAPEYEHVFLELIDGELLEMTRPNRPHGLLASNISGHIWLYLQSHDIGELSSETGFHPPDDRDTLLGPDVAFLRHERLPQPPSQRFVAAMPDLAVEILSPSETYASARRKAEIYLLNGTSLVWLVLPASREVEVCRLAAAGGVDIKLVSRDGTLSGEDILPGFTLPLRQLFAVLRE